MGEGDDGTEGGLGRGDGSAWRPHPYGIVEGLGAWGPGAGQACRVPGGRWSVGLLGAAGYLAPSRVGGMIQLWGFRFVTRSVTDGR